MLVVCPSCATSYDVELASLPPNGRQVRCVRCRTVWFAKPNHADQLVAAAAAIAPDGGIGTIADTPADAAMPQPTFLSEAEDDAAGADREAGDESAPAMAAAEASSEAEDGAAEDEADEVGADEVEADEVEAPPIAPADVADGGLLMDVGGIGSAMPAEDVETAAARRQQQRRGALRLSLHWPLSRLKTGILALALVNIILVGWRSDVVRALPQTASLYALLGLPVNLRDLTFEDVATTTEEHEGMPIVVVEGYVRNAARRNADVPRLKFVVRNAARQEIYSWTAVPARTSLPPGEAVAFRTRLVSPPPEAHDLVLRFVNRRDIVAATR